jgi:hypothetical protein
MPRLQVILDEEQYDSVLGFAKAEGRPISNAGARLIALGLSTLRSQGADHRALDAELAVGPGAEVDPKAVRYEPVE